MTAHDVRTADGVTVHMFAPAGATRAPALIFLHERYGLQRHTLDLCEKAAGDGFVGIAPDLFSRWEGDRDALAAGTIRVFLPDGDVAATLGITIDLLKTDARVDPARIVIVGVCQSGRYAIVTASERRDVAAIVVLYGAAQDRDWETTESQPRGMGEMIASLRVPALLLYGEADHTISLPMVRRVRDAFEDARRSYRMRVFAGMPHGWLNDTMPGRFRPQEAAEAWAMLTGFTREVCDGEWPADRVHWEFAADSAVDYDFTKNVRYE